MDSSFFLTTVAAAVGFFTLLKKLRFRQEDNKENNASSLPPSSSLPPPSSLSPISTRLICTYHVFPSFRGEDVRGDFLSHIQMEFQRKGITPFVDNEIKRGESIGPELIRAIRGSKIAIIFLSRNYASSSWCLDELAEIMKCREELGQTVIVVFYKVDPYDVKKLAGDFGEVFRKTCVGNTKEDTGRWRQALAKVATIAGYHSSNWDNEAAMIKEIVTQISKKLNNYAASSDFDGLVGMRAHLENMEPLLCQDSEEVRMIGIWGPSGIGKTTIARVAYSQLSNRFQLSVFMENIKQKYTRPCSDDYSAKLHLQQQFISQITNEKDIEIPHLGIVQDRLKDKKVLVILDGVDHSVQLDAIAKETWWFGPGSRIIITTQDHRLLRVHGINNIYKVGFPSTDEALQIFCTYAFGQKSPANGFEELAREVTSLVGKLPLGLRVMGCHFKRLSTQEWYNELPRLRTFMNKEIGSILKFSYDALGEEDQNLFLHTACFFNRGEIKKVEAHLGKMFLGVRQGLNFLAERSLISIDHGYIEIHDLLVQLGKEIVRNQSRDDPGKRQFLVDGKEIHEILLNAEGSKKVTGIDFNFSSIQEYKGLDVKEGAFKKMSNLRFLSFYGKDEALHLPRGLDYLSPKLQLLQWKYYPLTSLPSCVNSESLIEVDLGYSNLDKLWEGSKPLQNLRWMNLSYSENLKELPDLSSATNLQILNLSDCSGLEKLPSSIGNAINLQKLNLARCPSLEKLPSSIGNATNLQKLFLTRCSNLVELPSSIGNVTNLLELDLHGCSSLVELPSSIGNATNLQELNLQGCSSMVELPSSIGNATNLQELNLRGCSNLMELPSSIGNLTNLQELYLNYCKMLEELPSSIGNLTKLQELNLRECIRLQELPSSIGNLQKLRELDIRECSELKALPTSIINLETLVIFRDQTNRFGLN